MANSPPPKERNAKYSSSSLFRPEVMTTGLKTLTRTRIVNKKKRLSSSAMRLVPSIMLFSGEQKQFDHFQANDIRQEDSTAPTRCSHVVSIFSKSHIWINAIARAYNAIKRWQIKSTIWHSDAASWTWMNRSHSNHWNDR